MHLRPLNKCRTCKETWFPRQAKVRSYACPACNSPHTRLALGFKESLLVLTLVGGGAVLALWLSGSF